MPHDPSAHATGHRAPSHELPHQEEMANPAFTRSAATPQHGRKPDADLAKLKERRGFHPAPGH